jgi:hypothetical protein
MFLPQKAGALQSDALLLSSFSFFFPLYLARLPASLGTPCSFLPKEKEKEKEERGKGGITLGCTRFLRE